MKTINFNKPILVTGGGGYIASWIIKYLLEKNHTVRFTVRNIDNADKYKHLIDIANVLRTEYGNKFPIPKNTLPKFLLYLFGPFQGFSWKYIKKNIGIPMKFDNSRSKKELKIKYKNIKKTIIDH